jgi:drug/metabolite transporter (DMT)-like permease
MALNLMLFLATALIWGSTWLAIKLQITQVPPLLSVGYRFCLAGLILLVFSAAAGKRLSFSRTDHLYMGLQGVTLFGLCYSMSYLATSHMTSGLVAVVFSTILMWNIFNLRLFLHQSIAWRAFFGGALGLAGLGFIFGPDLLSTAGDRLIGLGLAFAGAYLASVGNVVGTRHSRRALPVTQCNGFGMLYGGLLNLAIHFLSGGRAVMDWSPGYLGPLLYLTLFGSAAAFGCYMLLIGRIGAEFAAYAPLLVPVIALALSTLFEGYRWSAWAVLGLLLVVGGNLVILTPKTLGLRLARRLGRG